MYMHTKACIISSMKECIGKDSMCNGLARALFSRGDAHGIPKIVNQILINLIRSRWHRQLFRQVCREFLFSEF